MCIMLQQSRSDKTSFILFAIEQNSPMESMAEEREKATFDVRELTYFLDGGEKSTKVCKQENTKKQNTWA